MYTIFIVLHSCRVQKVTINTKSVYKHITVYQANIDIKHVEYFGANIYRYMYKDSRL